MWVTKWFVVIMIKITTSSWSSIVMISIASSQLAIFGFIKFVHCHFRTPNNYSNLISTTFLDPIS